MMETKYFKGIIMLFGLFRIRKEFAFWQEFGGKDVQIGVAYVDNVKFLERLEPWLQRWCTIKWIETTPENEPVHCYL